MPAPTSDVTSSGAPETMIKEPFKFTDDGTRLIVLADLKQHVAAEFDQACEALLDGAGSEVTVDLSRIQYISSSSLGTLIFANVRASEKNQRLVLEVPRQLLTVLDLMSLRELIETKVVDRDQETKSSRNVVVVHSDPSIAALYADLLRSNGHPTESTCSPEQAVSLVDQSTPTVLVLDVDLPQKRGPQVAWNLREKGHEMPIVGLLSPESNWDRDDLRDLGFSLLLPKPIESDALLISVRDLALDRPNGQMRMH